MINYRLKIDFSDSKTLASDICFVSGDVKSSTLYFEFYNAGKRVDISGYTLSVRAKRSDGVVVASSGKIKENTAVFTPESNMYCVPGELYMEIALTDATGKYATTKIITAEVIEGLGEAAIEAVDNLNVYVKLISDAISAKEDAKAFAEVAKNVHPEIRDGIWWVYDTDKATMVSTGIKAEGPQGIKGEKGDQGIPGYTPQREIDYWTLEDKNRINKYVDDALEEISDTLNTKIDEISEYLGEEVENLQNQCSNALKGSVNGEIISITDISPVEHNLGVKVLSKNLTNKDGFITYGSVRKYLDVYLPAGKYYYSSNLHTASGVTFFTSISPDGELSENNYIKMFSAFGASQDGGGFTIKESGTYRFLIYCTNVDNFNALEAAWDSVWIQIEKGTTATPFAPFVDVSAATLSTTGKNLFKTTDYSLGSHNTSGSGLSNSMQDKAMTTDFIYLASGDYVLSNIAGANLRFVSFYNLNKEWVSNTWINREKTFKFTVKEACYIRIDIERADSVVIDNFDTFIHEYQFMLEKGTTATEYEPYIEPAEYSVLADGRVENVKSIYPNTTLLTDTQGVLIECGYNKDINKVIESLTNAIISLGGNV